MPPDRSWVIGAAPDCDVVVDLPTVSGRHCRLVQSPAGFLLEDLQSTNGTYVNGRKVGAPVAVSRSDAILLGSKVAFPWQKIAAHEKSQPAAAAGTTVAVVPPSSDRRPIVAALCGVVLSVALLGYALVGAGPRNTGRPQPPNRTASSSKSLARLPADPPDESSASRPPRGGEQRGAAEGTKSRAAKPSGVTAAGDVVGSSERGVVWVGFRLRDVAFFYATGWLVSPTRAVTTAAVITELEPLAASGIEPVVGQEGRIVAVTGWRRHPEFDKNDPGSRLSVHADVGVGELAEPLDTACLVATSEDLSSLSGTGPFTMIGYVSQLRDNEPFDELKVKRQRKTVELVSSDSLASNSTRVYKLSAPAQDAWRGAPVFGNRGRVVGVLTVIGGEARMVPVSQLSPLLAPAPNKK
jgi:hypothetical protein